MTAGLLVSSVGRGIVFPSDVGGNLGMLVVQPLRLPMFFESKVLWLLGGGARKVVFLVGRNEICQMGRIPSPMCSGKWFGLGLGRCGFFQ